MVTMYYDWASTPQPITYLGYFGPTCDMRHALDLWHQDHLTYDLWLTVSHSGCKLPLRGQSLHQGDKTDKDPRTYWGQSYMVCIASYGTLYQNYLIITPEWKVCCIFVFSLLLEIILFCSRPTASCLERQLVQRILEFCIWPVAWSMVTVSTEWKVIWYPLTGPHFSTGGMIFYTTPSVELLNYFVINLLL